MKNQYEVIFACGGKQALYSDAEFTGSLEQCEEYITETLREQRRIPGMQNTGTFLAIRDAETGEWQ